VEKKERKKEREEEKEERKRFEKVKFVKKISYGERKINEENRDKRDKEREALVGNKQNSRKMIKRTKREREGDK